MRRHSRSTTGWLLLCVWAVWLFALQGFLGRRPVFESWIPDLGLVLLLGLATRLNPSRLWLAALLVGCSRAALSSDPPAAVLAGYLGAALLLAALHEVIDLERTSLRVGYTALAALALGIWLALVQRLQLGGMPAGVSPVPVRALTSALVTAAAALVLGQSLLHLPGLPRLWRPSRG